MNKITVVFILLFTFLLNICDSQSLSVNTDGTSADTSAILDVKSTTKGVLIPRVTSIQKNAINLPAVGLLVYQTDSTKGFWFFDGSNWKNLSASIVNTSGLRTFASLKNGSLIVVYTGLNAYGFCSNVSGTPTWYPQTFSGTPVGGIATDSLIVIYTATTAYGFTRNLSGTPTWYSQSLLGTPTGITGSGNMIVVSTSTNLYGFTRNVSGTPTWYSQSTSGIPIGALANDKDCIVIYTATSAYGFITNISGFPSWYTQSISGTPIGGSASGKLLMVYTSTSAYGFTRNISGTPTWYSQAFSEVPIGIIPQ